MKSDNLILIGTSHIARESIHKVEDALLKEKPEIVALELDRPRLFALLNKGRRKTRFSLKAVRRVGIKGLLFSILGEYIERKLGRMVGTKPGDEMRHAYFTAQKERIRVALIDQDITKTLGKLSKQITWKEKFTFLKDIAFSLFRPKKIPFDLNRIPSKGVIKKMVGELKKKYPSVYRVLIKERNEVMGNNLAKLMERFPESKIVAVIGAGHEKEIRDIVEKNINA